MQIAIHKRHPWVNRSRRIDQRGSVSIGAAAPSRSPPLALGNPICSWGVSAPPMVAIQVYAARDDQHARIPTIFRTPSYYSGKQIPDRRTFRHDLHAPTSIRAAISQNPLVFGIGCLAFDVGSLPWLHTPRNTDEHQPSLRYGSAGEISKRGSGNWAR